MNIQSKWLRALFACLMLVSAGFVAGCADDAPDASTESLDDSEGGSADIGGGGTETP